MINLKFYCQCSNFHLYSKKLLKFLKIKDDNVGIITPERERNKATAKESQARPAAWLQLSLSPFTVLNPT